MNYIKLHNLIIKKINKHDLGPTYSLRQLEIDKSPFPGSLCDFLVEMEYKNSSFLKKGIFSLFLRVFILLLWKNNICYMKINQ